MLIDRRFQSRHNPERIGAAFRKFRRPLYGKLAGLELNRGP